MPIKIMMPMTILQGIALSFINYPYYFNIANFYPDPVEKMKFVITACFSCYHKAYHLKKPVKIKFKIKLNITKYNSLNLNFFFERNLKFFR